MSRPAALLIATLLAGCGACPRPPPCEHRAQLYPSHNGDIPVCPWILEARSCAPLDYDNDHDSDLDDLRALCARDHDGDTLTLDTISPGDTSAWCYTCD